MQKIMYLLLAVATLGFPAAAGAYTVQSTSVSSSQTGGVSAKSGEVITTGSSDVYAEIHTTVKGNSSGGTSTVYVETNTDGVVHRETTTKTIPPGGNVFVEARSHAGTKADTKLGSTTRSLASSTASYTFPTFRAFRNDFFGGFFHIFQNIFGWFGR